MMLCVKFWYLIVILLFSKIHLCFRVCWRSFDLTYIPLCNYAIAYPFTFLFVTFVLNLCFCWCENGLEMPILIHVQKPWVIGCMNVKFEKMPSRFPKFLPQITVLLATFKRDSGDMYLLQYLIFYVLPTFVNQVDVVWHFTGVLVFISLG